MLYEAVFSNSGRSPWRISHPGQPVQSSQPSQAVVAQRSSFNGESAFDDSLKAVTLWESLATMSDSNATNMSAAPAIAPTAKLSAAAHEQAGLQFLEQLESKHNLVLDELDALNARIEQVLQHYAASRQAPASHSSEAPAVAGQIQPHEQSDLPQRRAA